MAGSLRIQEAENFPKLEKLMKFCIFQMFEFFKTWDCRSNSLKYINETMRHLLQMPKLCLKQNGRIWTIANMNNIINRK